MIIAAIVWAAAAGFSAGCCVAYRDVGLTQFGEEWYWASIAIATTGTVVFWGLS